MWRRGARRNEPGDGKNSRKSFHLRNESGRAKQGGQNFEMEGHRARRADIIGEEREERQTSEVRRKEHLDLKYETGSNSKGNH